MWNSIVSAADHCFFINFPANLRWETNSFLSLLKLEYLKAVVSFYYGLKNSSFSYTFFIFPDLNDDSAAQYPFKSTKFYPFSSLFCSNTGAKLGTKHHMGG